MATDTIRYDLDVLRSKETQLNSIGKDLSDIKKTMKQLNNMVDDFWEGDASSSFKTQNTKTIDRIQELKEHVDSAKKNLVEAISKYSANEDTNKGIVEDLSTEGIF
ncbi:MAG: WXG100 family type VII secretion target [Eubacterium sp.]|nr:WXG100 family type VII secretion target [Eubacterium sp.]